MDPAMAAKAAQQQTNRFIWVLQRGQRGVHTFQPSGTPLTVNSARRSGSQVKTFAVHRCGTACWTRIDWDACSKWYGAERLRCNIMDTISADTDIISGACTERASTQIARPGRRHRRAPTSPSILLQPPAPRLRGGHQQREHRPDPRLALHRYLAIHPVRQLLADREPQPRASLLARVRAATVTLSLHECLENVLQLLPWNADPRIANAEAHERPPAREGLTARRMVDQSAIDRYGATRVGELYRIG